MEGGEDRREGMESVVWCLVGREVVISLSYYPTMHLCCFDLELSISLLFVINFILHLVLEFRFNLHVYGAEMRGTKSHLWDFFENISIEKARCLTCKGIVPRGGSTAIVS